MPSQCGSSATEHHLSGWIVGYPDAIGQLAKNRYFTNKWVLSVNAFHEKAGRSQVGGSYLLGKIFSLPSRHCRHPSIRTLLMSDCSLGASWVFSFQPVLPPVYRPCLPSPRRKLGQAINAVTGTRRLSFVFLFSSMFLITLLPASSPGCCSARARTLLRSPIDDAARRLTSAPWQ